MHSVGITDHELYDDIMGGAVEGACIMNRAVSETMGDLGAEGRQGKTFLTVRVACGHFAETL